MSLQFCLALLALSSLTAASHPDCDELIQPLEDQSKIAGKWIYYAGTSDDEDQLKQLKFINSSWIELSPIPDSIDMTLRWGDRMNGKCYHGAVNSSFSVNTTKVIFHFNATTHVHSGKHLKTCPDCILWVDTSVSEMEDGESTKARNLYLFTKSGTLDASHLEVFKKQVTCLNFQEELHFGGATNLCPDSSDAKEKEQ